MKSFIGFFLGILTLIVSVFSIVSALIFHSFYEKEAYLDQIEIESLSEEYGNIVILLDSVDNLPFIEQVRTYAKITKTDKWQDTLNYLISAKQQITANLFKDSLASLKRAVASNTSTVIIKPQELEDITNKLLNLEKIHKELKENTVFLNKVKADITGYEDDYAMFSKDLSKLLNISDSIIGGVDQPFYEFGLLAGLPKIIGIEDSQNDLIALLRNLFRGRDEETLKAKSSYFLQRIESLRDLYQSITKNHKIASEKKHAVSKNVEELKEFTSKEKITLQDKLSNYQKIVLDKVKSSFLNERIQLKQEVSLLNFFLD